MEERGISGTQKIPTPKRRWFLCKLNPTVRVLGTEPSAQLSQSPREASLCSFSSLRKKAVLTKGLHGWRDEGEEYCIMIQGSPL